MWTVEIKCKHHFCFSINSLYIQLSLPIRKSLMFICVNEIFHLLSHTEVFWCTSHCFGMVMCLWVLGPPGLDYVTRGGGSVYHLSCVCVCVCVCVCNTGLMALVKAQWAARAAQPGLESSVCYSPTLPQEYPSLCKKEIPD